jgi:hypothetical protein
MKIYNLTISLHLFASIFQALLINYAKLHFPLRYVALLLHFAAFLSLSANLRGAAIALLFVGDQIGHDVTIYKVYATEKPIGKQIVDK